MIPAYRAQTDVGNLLATGWQTALNTAGKMIAAPSLVPLREMHMYAMRQLLDRACRAFEESVVDGAVGCIQTPGENLPDIYVVYEAEGMYQIASEPTVVDKLPAMAITSQILGGSNAIDPITSRTVNGWQKIHPPVDVAISGKSARRVADELALRFDEIIPLPYMDFNDIRAIMTNGILRLMTPGYNASRDQLYEDMQTIERIMRRVSSMLLRHFVDDEDGIRRLLASDEVQHTREQAAAFFEYLFQYYEPGDGGIIDFIAGDETFDFATDRGTAIANAFVLFEASAKSLGKIASNLLIQASHNHTLFHDIKERNVTLHNAIVASAMFSTSNDITFREATVDFEFENGQMIPAGSTIVLNLSYALRPYAKHLFISPTNHNIDIVETFPRHHRYLPWLFRGNFPKDVPDRGCSGMAYSFQVISRFIDIVTSHFEGIEIVSRPIDDITATRGYAVKFCLY